MECPSCRENKLRHVHDCVHGIPGTHMEGSERFECECGFCVSDKDDAAKYNLIFIMDK